MNPWFSVAKLRKIKRLYILIFCVCCVLLCVTNCTPVKTSTVKNATSNLSGQILVNLFDNSDNFYEFNLSLPAGDVKKTYEGEIQETKDEKGERKYIRFTDNYKKIFDRERWYNKKMEEKLKETIETSDFYKLDDRKILPKNLDLNNIKYSSYFFPNKQFTHAIYNPCEGCRSKLINLKTKQISSIFSADEMSMPVWDKTGYFVAYNATKFLSSDTSVKFVITDISAGKEILRQKLDESLENIADIAFSSDSKYIAVLSYIKKPGFWPHEILLIGMGHGVFNETYFIEIYDFHSNLVYKKKVDGSYKNSMASMIWVTNDTMQ